MSTYTQAPYFQTYNSNPYQLPVQQIVQAIGMRNEYWDQGASKIKNAYQNYLGMDLGLQANQEKLNKYMTDVNNNLKGIVKNDLSLADNVDSAMKVFDPITNDEDLKYDNNYTKFIKGQIQSAQSYRTKDNGAGYSDTNVADMMTPYQEFVRGNDPSKGREAYGNRRYYTPYHDVAADQKELYKNFKPNTSDLTEPPTETYVDPKDGKTKTRLTADGYLVQTKNASIVKEQYRTYLEANLSDKAKEQLNINGRVAYKDDINALAKDYMKYNKDDINIYNTEIARLKGLKRIAENDHKQSEADQYDTKIKDYESIIKDKEDSNSKIQIGDLSELTTKKDKIAARIYSDKWYNYISTAAERSDITIKYSSDNTAMLFHKMDNDNQNKNLDRILDWKINEADNATKMSIAKLAAENAKKIKDDDGLTNTTLETRPAFKDDNETIGREEINKEIDNAVKLKADANEILTNTLISLGIEKAYDPNAKETKEQQQAANEAAFQKWAANKKPNDPIWTKYCEAFDLANTKLATANAINTFVDSEMARLHPIQKNAINTIMNGITSNKTISYAQLVDKDGNIKGAKDINLTKEEIQKLLSDNDPNIRIETTKDDKWSTNQNTDRGTFTGTTGVGMVPHSYLYYKGDKYLIADRSAYWLFNSMNEIRTEKDKIDIEKNKMYDEAYTRIKGIQSFNTPVEKSKDLMDIRNVIANRFIGVTGIKEDGIRLTGKDNDGNIYFKLDVTPDGVSKKEIEKIADAAGIKKINMFGSTYILPNKEVAGIVQSKTFSDPRLATMQKQVDFIGFHKKNGESWMTTPMRFNNIPFHFMVINDNGSQTFRIVHEDSNAIFDNVDDMPFKTLDDAAMTANMLSKLEPEDLLKKIRDIKTGNKPEYKK